MNVLTPVTVLAPLTFVPLRKPPKSEAIKIRSTISASSQSRQPKRLLNRRGLPFEGRHIMTSPGALTFADHAMNLLTPVG